MGGKNPILLSVSASSLEKHPFLLSVIPMAFCPLAFILQSKILGPRLNRDQNALEQSWEEKIQIRGEEKIAGVSAGTIRILCESKKDPNISFHLLLSPLLSLPYQSLVFALHASDDLSFVFVRFFYSHCALLFPS